MVFDMFSYATGPILPTMRLAEKTAKIQPEVFNGIPELTSF